MMRYGGSWPPVNSLAERVPFCGLGCESVAEPGTSRSVDGHAVRRLDLAPNRSESTANGHLLCKLTLQLYQLSDAAVCVLDGFAKGLIDNYLLERIKAAESEAH